MHAHNQNVLIVRPIKNHHLAAPWRNLVRTPEEVVGELLLGRLLELKDESPLRVESRKEMANGAILSGRIEALQHNKQRLTGVRIKQILQPRHTLDLLRRVLDSRLT